ncbi:MAG: hypothetical protein ACRC6E_05320 [Fusobacteriaceae bacterium]
MNCGFCGNGLILVNDFDAEDYGYEYVGIVSLRKCTKCGAIWEGVQLHYED